jgi:hypothetical protein
MEIGWSGKHGLGGVGKFGDRKTIEKKEIREREGVGVGPAYTCRSRKAEDASLVSSG